MKKSAGLLIVLTIMILVTGCQSLQSRTNGAPILKLEHGWSPVRHMELNGEQKAVKCMTVEDVDKLTNYLIIIQENGR